MLYLVATPIGNLEDMSPRAIRLLKEADLILAEDTRTSKKLLNHFEIETPVKSFHAHNEHKKLNEYIELLKSGSNICLISDAGTPGISDPGFLLVRACHENDVPLSSVPGPSALISALIMSGLPCDKFHFEGFLPKKKGRLTRMKYILKLDITSVIYVSPHKLLKTLSSFNDLCEEPRPAAVVREISKIYEEVITGDLMNIKLELESRTSLKGEYVLVIGGKK